MNIQEIKQAIEDKQIVLYSDFGITSYVYIKPLKITRIKRKNCWFEAEIVDNTIVDNQEFYKTGSIHSFSNSFIYKNYKALVEGKQAYKKTQIDFIKNHFYIVKQKLD